MANPWFRFHGGDYLSDPKMDVLDGNERSIWITLLCFANQNSGTVKSISEKHLIERAGIRANKKKYTGTLEKFMNLGMVQLSNGDVTICNWAKRQYSESYQRVLDYRQKSNDLKRNRNGNVTPHTDTDTDTESDTDTDNTFDRFWTSYPRKVAKGKAGLAWKKIPTSEHEAIFRHIEFSKQTEQWRKSGGQFIPHPTTYLNQERWKEQIELQSHSPPKITKCQNCKKPSTSFLCRECEVPVRNPKLADLKKSFPAPSSKNS